MRRGRGASGAASSSTRAPCGDVARGRPPRAAAGSRAGRRLARPRTARCGSSASTVPVPTTTASTSARSSCTSARASAEVIHRLVPSAAATRPSSVEAAFQVTNGRPCVTAKVQAALSASASSASTPPTTSTPASAQTPGATRGHGVGVGLPVDDARHARLEHASAAGAGAPGVVAGLEGDDGGGAAGEVARGAQRVDLGVRRSGTAVEALAHHRRRPATAGRSRRGGWGRWARTGSRPARGHDASRRSRARWLLRCSRLPFACSGPHDPVGGQRRGRRATAGA